ncbi:MAG: caspase family protein [Acidobacteria bacterium]|nr:caspase family protein [Acidobacteriota bacterium]
MKTPLHLVTLLAVVAASLLFCWTAPDCLAQARGRGVRKNTTVASSAEQRVALVIGNGAYADGALANSVNDARDIAATLRQLGFAVSSGENLNRRRMEELIRDFGAKIRSGGVGMFYFAGHGVQVNGANYLIPIGATINGAAEVKFEAVDVGFVLAQMEEAQNRLNIVVLDACRNNPFARSFRSSSGGLASIDAPVGTFIAYATAPGRTASDGGGRNGLYTKELLAAMRLPGLRIEDVFKRVRSEVRRQSNNKQIPWEASSIEGDFYFSTTGVRPAPAVATPAPTVSAPAPIITTPASTVSTPAPTVSTPAPIVTTPASTVSAPASTVATPAPTVATPAPTLAEMLRQAKASARGNDYDGVISAAQKALIADPNSGVAYRFLYAAYYFQHDTDRANQARDNAIRLLKAPKDAVEYEARGATYIFINGNRAIADFSEAIRLDPKFEVAYRHRAMVYREIGRHVLAEADEREAKRLRGN